MERVMDYDYICSSCEQPCDIKPTSMVSGWGHVLGSETSTCCNARAVSVTTWHRLRGTKPDATDLR